MLRIKERAGESRPKQVVEARKSHGTLRSEPLQCGMSREDSQPVGVAHVCVCNLRTEVEAEGSLLGGHPRQVSSRPTRAIKKKNLFF